MPIYDYECKSCKETVEDIIARINEEVKCPDCKKVMIRLMPGTHSINMGVLLILVGLLVPLLARAEGSGMPLLAGFVVAACLYPAGLLLIALKLTFVGEIVAALGAGLAIAVFALLFLKFSAALKSITE